MPRDLFEKIEIDLFLLPSQKKKKKKKKKKNGDVHCCCVRLANLESQVIFLVAPKNRCYLPIVRVMLSSLGGKQCVAEIAASMQAL